MLWMPKRGSTRRILVEVALEVNPQVKSARARWEAAVHSIKQNYAPADPIFSYQNIDSPTNGFSDASLHSLQLSQALQFPGKALLQADQARQAAEVARLTYEAMIRDVRAQTETAYYQALLDGALSDLQGTTVDNLRRVLNVTQVAYSANQVTQTDFISAEYDLAVARQQQEQLSEAEANDETTIDQLLYRRPQEPLKLDRKFELNPLTASLDHLIDRAIALRQEILETALAQSSSEVALRLARLEYAPDYTLGLSSTIICSRAQPRPQIDYRTTVSPSRLTCRCSFGSSRTRTSSARTITSRPRATIWTRSGTRPPRSSPPSTATRSSRIRLRCSIAIR